MAHYSIAASLKMHALPNSADLPPELWEPRGVFTTLYLLREVGGDRRDEVPDELPKFAPDKIAGGAPSELAGKLRRELRGCVGYALPVAPLFRAVVETARAAAFEDSRFPPVTRQETLELKVSLSVLSPLFPIHPDAVEIGRHGLLISDGAKRGLLLPQVPIEQGWERETFLEQTCRKAGLPLDCWRKSATIEAFTAEVFNDFDS